LHLFSDFLYNGIERSERECDMDFMQGIPLRVGDAGPGVLEVQRILSALGYPIGQMDGNFDTATLRAVIAFQSDNSLPIDGIVAVNTWTALQRRAESRERSPELVMEAPKGVEQRASLPPVPLVPPSVDGQQILPVPPPVQPPIEPMPMPETPLMPEARQEAFFVPTVPPVAWTQPAALPVLEGEPLRDPSRGWIAVQATS